MIITKRSPLSGKVNSMDLDITQEQLDAWNNGTQLIQEAFPHLNTDEREFLLTGITSPEWDEAFGSNE